jgi:hypothetical protein
MTVREYIARAKTVQTSVKGYVDDIALMKQDEVINMNIIQMEKGLGTNDSKLNYANGYTGTYKQSTVQRSLLDKTVLPKVYGELYNFGWFGDYLSNFKVRVVKENKLEVYSTGTGTGGKSVFLTRTQYMYGLNAEDTRKLNYEIIYPELMKFIKQFI